MITMSKKKKIISREVAEEAVKAYQNLTRQIEKKEAAKDEAVKKVTNKYDSEVYSLAEAAEPHAVLIEEYAIQERAALFGDKKSTDFLGSKLGFRTGKLQINIAEGMTEQEALAKVKIHLPHLVQTKESVNKSQLRKDILKITPNKLALCGFEVEKGTEEFSIK